MLIKDVERAVILVIHKIENSEHRPVASTRDIEEELNSHYNHNLDLDVPTIMNELKRRGWVESIAGQRWFLTRKGEEVAAEMTRV